jgi:hypothetical protein
MNQLKLPAGNKFKIFAFLFLFIFVLVIVMISISGPFLTNISTNAAQKRLNETIAELNGNKGNIKIAPIKQDTDGNGQSTGVAFDTTNRTFLIFSCSTNWGPLTFLESPKCILKDIDLNNARGESISDFKTAVWRGSDGNVAKAHAEEFVSALGLQGKLILADSVKGDENNFNVNLILDQPVTTPDGRTTTQILLRVDKKWTVFPPGFKYLGGATPTLNAGGAGTNIRTNPVTR